MTEERRKREVFFREKWSKKSAKIIKKEIDSYQRYFEKNIQSYEWHGRYQQHPDELSDGDRIRILKEILECQRV